MKRYVIAMLVMLSAFGAAGAQEQVPVQVQGRVAWVSGQSMVVVPDGSPGIRVDISQVPQEQHGLLREGDRVIVIGTVPNPRNRVVAATVERLGQ